MIIVGKGSGARTGTQTLFSGTQLCVAYSIQLEDKERAYG